MIQCAWKAGDKRDKTREKHIKEYRAVMKGREHEHDEVDVPERMGVDLRSVCDVAS